MTKKKIVAIMSAVLMLATLFTACSSDKTNSDNDTTANTSVTDTSTAGQTSDGSGDTTGESSPYDVSFLFVNMSTNSYNYDEALKANFATYQYLEQMALEQNNLAMVRSSIEIDAYATTVNSFLASNSMTDGFFSGYTISDDEMLKYVNAGTFANIDDILRYSDGTASSLLGDGGSSAYIRALAIMEDGGWYEMGLPDGNNNCINLDHDDVHYFSNWPMHTWYNMSIRRDWLDDCGLDMPQSTQEFYDALVAFQENDCNGSGAKDERAYLGIGEDDYIFCNGVAQWFGLPKGNFAMDPATGEILNAIESETYIDYITYMQSLYNAGLTYTDEGGPWSYTNDVAGNNCSAHVQYPDFMCQVSNASCTGDADAQYDQMPIIQAVEGVNPTVQGQPSKSANNGMTFISNDNYAGDAALLDFVYSKVFYMTITYGLEGKAWDYNDDGSITMYTLSEEDDLQYGDCWHYFNSFWPQVQLGWVWDPSSTVYDSFQDALDNGEPYTWKNLTQDQWKEQNSYFNWDNYSPLQQYYEMMADIDLNDVNMSIHQTFGTPAYADELDVIAMYETDLTTYLEELTTNYITGTRDLSTYEDDLQVAYDELGFAEYTKVMQNRTNRYLENIDFPTYEG